MALVRRYHPTLIRLAATYVPGRAAEEVARDTWQGMLCGLDGFDGRASLRAWLFGILVSRARSADDRGRHSGPVTGYAAGPGRFRADGSWVLPPIPWPGDAGARLRAPAASPAIRAAIEELPPWPRRVVLLRDVEGLASREVRQVLAISDARQRVLLHHGRSRIRQALEQQARRV